MDGLPAVLLQLGIWGVMLFILVWIAYFQAPGGLDGWKRWRAALSTRWLLVAWTVVALLAWVWTWLCVLNGLAYLRGFGRWTWLPAVLIVGAVAGAAIALLATRYWQRRGPWPTLVIAVAMILGSTAIRGPLPAEWPLKSGDTGDAVTFIQQRLETLGCYETDAYGAPSAGQFDAPTAQAVIDFQRANKLPAMGFDGRVRRDPEFRRLANPFAGVGRCPRGG